MQVQPGKLSLILLLMAQALPARADGQCPTIDLDGDLAKSAPQHLRVATFNTYLNRRAEGGLIADLRDPSDQLSGKESSDRQIGAVAEIIQRVRPDVLLLNEFDYDSDSKAIDLFQRNFLEVSQSGRSPIHYPYHFSAVVNTGVPSGFDLNNDGKIAGPEDSFGYGEFPGQYGMVLLSMFPIDEQAVRTFQKFLWKDMPGASLPDDPGAPAAGDWYNSEELKTLRLSSKSHWDVPVKIKNQLVHILMAHPTPPGFDGPEDRNGRRNHDEIRFWADYVSGDVTAAYIQDDQGGRGGLEAAQQFVILGDYNADLNDGSSFNHAIAQLLNHPRINARIAPSSLGAEIDSLNAKKINTLHKGDPALDTADFNPEDPGNLRADYVLPSIAIEAICGGVFWPAPADASYYLVGSGFPVVSSDHHLVWLDVVLPE